MKITDAFRGEHGVFYAQFHWIESVLDLSDLRSVQAAAAMLASALAPHAHLENELMFDVIRKLNRGSEPVPFTIMRDEHDSIEGLLEAIQKTTDARRAEALLLDAVMEARLHFVKEEEVAFIIVEQTLSDAQLHDLGNLWGERRGVHLFQFV